MSGLDAFARGYGDTPLRGASGGWGLLAPRPLGGGAPAGVNGVHYERLFELPKFWISKTQRQLNSQRGVSYLI